MIGKVKQGTGFKRLLHYLHDKEQAQLIGGNIAGVHPRELLAEFHAARSLNLKLSKIVCHVSLSLPLQERLEDEQWGAIASDYLTAMGYEGCQYVVYRHHDQAHDHIHIVVSRIRLQDGTTVKDSWEKRRAEQVIRGLEQKYGLETVPSSWEKLESAPTTGEMRRFERTEELPIRVQLQQSIDAAAQQYSAMAEMVGALKSRGIGVRLRQTRAGITGISYEMAGIAFSGSKLGRAYSFPGLQKHRGIDYDPDFDRDATWLAAIQPVQMPERETAAVMISTEVIGVDEPDRAIENPAVPAPSQDYQQMWQTYSRGVQAKSQVKLDFLVAQKALKDRQTAKDVAKMLEYSPFVQEMIAQGKATKPIEKYIRQTVQQAGQEPQQGQVRQKKRTLGMGI